MPYLITVSIIWAFSFGIVGNRLAGVDPNWIATLRSLLALLLFLPLLRLQHIGGWRSSLPLLLCGAVQFGMMYLFLFASFRYLPSHQVALFSILTPIYVYALGDLQRRRFSKRFLLAAILSIMGALVIRMQTLSVDGQMLSGFLLLQGANLSFAAGQVYYRHWKQQHPAQSEHHHFALLFTGALALSLLWTLSTRGWDPLWQIDSSQWPYILYLGLVATGMGFFWWNKGASRVTPGALAASNNAVIPMAVFVSLFLFGEIGLLSIEGILRLIIGAAIIIFAMFIGSKKSAQSRFTDKNPIEPLS
jgi:drug/metabolite transporter (DMT)-like permease